MPCCQYYADKDLSLRDPGNEIEVSEDGQFLKVRLAGLNCQAAWNRISGVAGHQALGHQTLGHQTLGHQTWCGPLASLWFLSQLAHAAKLSDDSPKRFRGGTLRQSLWE
jgi:hypothetical protein